MTTLPLILYTYTAFHPFYGNTVTVDCAATDPATALASAQRFVRRQNRDLARWKSPGKMRVPQHVNDMKREG